MPSGLCQNVISILLKYFMFVNYKLVGECDVHSRVTMITNKLI